VPAKPIGLAPDEDDAWAESLKARFFAQEIDLLDQ